MKKLICLLLLTAFLFGCTPLKKAMRKQEQMISDIRDQRDRIEREPEAHTPNMVRESDKILAQEESDDKPDEKSPESDAKDKDKSKSKDKKKEKASALSGKIIVVDAGHGLSKNSGQEAIAPGSSQTKPKFVSGTSGKNQTEEQLNLAVALKLEAALKKKGAVVHMTRETHETTRSNIDRATFANDLGADISVKLHADGSENTSVKGVLMLVPGGQYIKDKNVITKSDTAGKRVLEAVVDATGAVNRGVSVRNDMTGFNWSTVPVILLEMGVMTNPEEDALLETGKYQDKIVAGIINGLELYFQ